ncbi:MAG: RtcB family protein [Deltaproteobacteria bacterium]|nr:RtcB family protein [Deltaproteobacteria bacterium]
MIEYWLTEPLTPEVKGALERLSSMEDIRHVAVMPDVHLSHQFCIGTVVASNSRLYPQAVGGDIGCGMMAIAFDVCAEDLFAQPNRAAVILKAFGRLIPKNRHSTQTLPDHLPCELDPKDLSDERLAKSLLRDGRVQLGTLGRGNHFVELQRDEQDRLWLMLHSGSRAAGQRLSEFHRERCRAGRFGYLWFDADSASGQAYLNDVEWARKYAHLNRWRMLESVAITLEELFQVPCDASTLISCDHNHVEQETHFEERLWVHRKGALRADPGETGVIPGSMGTASFHVTGRGCTRALRSSSHGAGRRMSRSEARRVVGTRQLQQQMGEVIFDHRLSSRLCDEAPASYKDITRVMRAQRELTRIDRRLQPVLSYKGV